MPPTKKPAATKTTAKAGGKRAAQTKTFPDTRLENTEPGHSKFWSIHLEENSTIIHYGKIGEDPGQVSGPKDHKTRKKAEDFFTTQIKSKIKKGYHDVAANDEGDETMPADKKRTPAAKARGRKARKQEVDPKHFAWGCGGGNSELLADGLIFKKGGGRETAGVRSKEPLPKCITWSVSWSSLGSHQAGGVADAAAPILFDGYGYVFGEATEKGESWAVCFTRVLDEFHVRHQGHEVEEFPSGVKPKPGTPVQLVFRREDSKLYVQLPGSKEEHLIFSDLPNTDLFAVASTPYKDCQILIQDPTDPRPSPDLSPPPTKKLKKTYPECPGFADADSKGSVRELMAGIEGGKWGVEVVERTGLMWKHRGKFVEPDEKQKSDVSFVMEHGLAFRDASSLEECFSERNCDDGIISCYKLKCTNCESMALTYYEGGFGGNSIGWVLVDEGGVTKLLACNCDGDLIWEGPDKSSDAAKEFTKEFRKARYD
eukprot:TRINITY_DN73063_c0_g1_i1.p1 TRINITY_DN73063_c0_g1~~TRINITY_DN73063_c0_g1_i1.p1  ORF type:complete len:484 (+),score=94.68 TRINITY_DN73063_c0_g1_i1:46-1497(+)